MESQPQNPEFRINPENFHPGMHATLKNYYLYVHWLLTQKALTNRLVFPVCCSDKHFEAFMNLKKETTSGKVLCLGQP